MSDPFSPEPTEVGQPAHEISPADTDVEEEYLPEDDDSSDDLPKAFAEGDASGESDESGEDDTVITEIWDDFDFSKESDEGGLWSDVGDAIGDILEDMRSDFAGETGGGSDDFGTWDLRDAGTWDLT